MLSVARKGDETIPLPAQIDCLYSALPEILRDSNARLLLGRRRTGALASYDSRGNRLTFRLYGAVGSRSASRSRVGRSTHTERSQQSIS
jgi:hypothetical protein